MYCKHSLVLVVTVCALALVVRPVIAQSSTGLSMAQRNACMACHQLEGKRVGPPLRRVAERYAGQGDAMLDYLSDKIRYGGRGAWGAVPMPAQTQVNQEQARVLAQWVLSLASARP